MTGWHACCRGEQCEWIGGCSRLSTRLASCLCCRCTLGSYSVGLLMLLVHLLCGWLGWPVVAVCVGQQCAAHLNGYQRFDIGYGWT